MNVTTTKHESPREMRFKSGDVELRAMRFGGSGPPVLLVHGLMANASCFRAVADAGLADACELAAPDLRGRGRSGKPKRGYSVRDHALDLIACLDAWGIKSAVFAGHSFGGLMSIYAAANFPERVKGLVLMDTPSPRVHNPLIMPMLAPSMTRLGATLPSLSQHLSRARQLPYLNGMWDDAIEGYFREDVEELIDGRVVVRAPPEAIAQSVQAVALEPWLTHVRKIKQPTLILHATESFGPRGYPPVILQMQVRDLMSLISDCEYQRISGNHVTMLFGRGASETAQHIARFADLV